MRKRRRLANKMTIMVCAVLIAVSAFFYAPMEVEAISSNTVSGSATADVYSVNNVIGHIETEFIDIDNIDSNMFYKVSLNTIFSLSFPSEIGYSLVRQVTFSLGEESRAILYYNGVFPEDSLDKTDSRDFEFVIKGSYLKSNKFFVNFRSAIGSKLPFSYDYELIFNLNSCVPLTGEESETYQQGYNAGYSAGEEVGESNGYSSGYSDGYDNGYGAGKTNGYESGYEQGSNDGYNSGFQAGVDSVDTQSYYDAGYQAGYQVAYSEGYESGYDEGYQSAMDRIASWGADTSDYPSLKYSFFDDELQLICDVFTSAPSTSYDSALLCYLDFDINPNHTYKFVVRTGGATGGASDALYSEYKLNFVIGSNVINATNNVGKTFNFFIPGYNMGSSILFEAFVYDCVYYGGVSEEDGFLKYSGQVYPTLKNCYIDIYDMGPSGDTQNHIANQTDQLTNGYDDSKGNMVNSELSTGLNDYETAENSLFATATTGMKDFTFFDFESVPAMITGMSFIGSIMGSWFNQAGGASGVGIVLSILFSVILVAMVLGLYRWYQSRGGKN